MDFSLRVANWIRFTTPAFLTIALVILSTVDLRIEGFANFVPHVGFICVFYWAAYSPRLMPSWFVFVLGMFQDFVYGTPLGISSFVSLMLWWLIVSQRRYLIRETFWVVWGVFSFVILIFTLLSSAIYSLYFGKYALSNDIFMQWIFSALLYPFMHKLFNLLREVFLKA